MKKRVPPWPWIAGALVIVAAVTAFWLLPVKEWMDAAESWVDEHGAMGRVAFALAYVIASLLLVPEWIFTVLAGALFGVFWGFAIAWTAAFTASILAFLGSRSVLREPVRRWLQGKRKLAAVDKALRDEGWKALVLLRLSPLMPFGIENYLLGTTRVKLVDYAIGTGLAITPGTLVYLFIGSTGRALAGDGGPATWAMLAAGLAATALFTWRIGKAAKKKLKLS